jgi:D-amino peptidase
MQINFTVSIAKILKKQDIKLIESEKMKAFISVDLEGMPYVVIPGQLNLKGSQYEEIRRIATKITLIVAEELNKNGFDKIIVADSHGPMVNLLVEELPEYVEIIRGSLRPTSMVAGAKDCDVVLFLGYHAKFGTMNSTFDHTYSGASVNKIVVNGIEASEYFLNTWAVGEYNIPCILLAGEKQLLEDDAKRYTPWVETVALKQSLSRLSALSPSLKTIEKELRATVNKALTNLKEKKTKPWKLDPPVKVILTLKDTHLADGVSLLPIVTRKDALTVTYEAKNMIEAYEIFQALMFISSCISGMLQTLG